MLKYINSFLKNWEVVFFIVPEKLIHLAKLYGIVEIKNYARSSKKLTVSQLEVLLIKNRIKLPENRSSVLGACAKKTETRLGLRPHLISKHASCYA